MMTQVKDLLKMLGEMDPEATVYLVTRSDHFDRPFEHDIMFVHQRDDFWRPEDDEDPEHFSFRKAHSNDVLLVSSGHVRHGDKRSWEAHAVRRSDES